MLLIDEPETALHPNAIRAARDYLYKLAEEDGWQIMLTTHSPVFVDPTLDQTTIVRLERSGSTATPRTFRSDSAGFSGSEREQLKQLMHFDTGLAEMFFGGYPIVIEGDTEYAAFIECMKQSGATFPLERRPVLIRARGKDAIVLVLRVLRHFKVPFSVLHDSDGPKTVKGSTNVAWSANFRIYRQVIGAIHDEKLRVIHQVSIPDFERHHGLPRRGKDKPWRVWDAVRTKADVLASVASSLKALLPGAAEVAFPSGALGGTEDLLEKHMYSELQARISDWLAKTNNTSREFDFTTPADEHNGTDDDDQGEAA